MATKTKSYVVVHQVGPYLPGSVIHFSDRHTKQPPDGDGISVERLKALGAIRDAEKDEADESVLYGTGSPIAEVIPFPPVPFEPTIIGRQTGTESLAVVEEATGETGTPATTVSTPNPADVLPTSESEKASEKAKK